MTTPNGDHLAKENSDERETAYNTLCNGMVEVCDMFSQFDASVAAFTTEPDITELRQLMQKLEQVKKRLERLVLFAAAHDLLTEAEDDDFTNKLTEMMDALLPRQEYLWEVGRAFWDVGRFSDEFWEKLEGCAAAPAAQQPGKEAVEERGEDCAIHCRLHSRSILDDSDIFQECSRKFS